MKPDQPSAQLDSVLEELGLPASSGASSVPRVVSKPRIVELMHSLDIHVLGAVYTFLMNRKKGRSVEPPLEFKDYHDFLLHYYERCFRENPESPWANSSYATGSDLVNWFGHLWRDKDVPSSAVAEIKTLLAKLYREGDENLRTCIVTGTLEHLFEQKEIRNYFDDWHEDAILGRAYSQALEWTQRGGQTPLRKSSSRRKREK